MQSFKQLPWLGKAKVHVRAARKGCEHLTFIGATTDALAFMAHMDWPVFVVAGKLAFVFGAVGIYLLHYEEACHL